MTTDWNSVMPEWRILYTKLISIEAKLKKCRRTDINRLALIKHVNDCIAAVSFEIRRVNIQDTVSGMKAVNELIEQGKFIYKN